MSPAPSPARHVLLLRGVNVSASTTVPMARLRELVAELGASAVRTHLNSGNVVCEAPGEPAETAAALAVLLEAEFGRPFPVVGRTAGELAAIVAADPLAAVADVDANRARALVLFLSAPPPAARLEAALARAAAVGRPEDRWVVAGHEIHLWVPAGIHDSKTATVFTDRTLGVVVTGRNWNTVVALRDLAGA